jgi:hemolysin activation/secretion protein
VKIPVRGYRVEGNSLLGDRVLLETLRRYVGDAVELTTIRQAATALAGAYRERGYVTVSVSLPPQQVTNGLVTLRVLEGRLTELRVNGNTHFSSNNVRRALPGLQVPALLNAKIFQAELDRANANRDRQIYPEIQPGEHPGESRLILKVQDRLPLHGRLEVNNQATPGTPDLRLNGSVDYGNLWQREHAAGLQYSFAPGEYKKAEPDWPLDWPLIASYSAFYRLPLGGLRSVPEQIAAQPGSFGYDEATRQFRLPPAAGRPALTVFGTRSTSDSGILQSPPEVYVSNSVTTIYGYDHTRSLTLNESVGARVAWPLAARWGVRSSLQGGLDLKHYSLQAYNTNYFVTRSEIPGANPGDPPEIRESIIQNPNPAKQAELVYLPLAVRWDAVRPDPLGSLTFGLGATVNLPLPPLSGDDAFRLVSGSSEGSASWASVSGGLGREQRLGGGWTLLARVDGQWSPGALISNEQFALGGVSTVRGYHEGEQYGDLGWRAGLEPRTPTWDVGLVDGRLPLRVRGAAFVEYGEAYLLDREVTLTVPGQPVRRWEPTLPALWGTGLAFSGNVGNRMDFRAAFAVALNASATVNVENLEVVRTEAGSWRAHFTVGLQF